jgi:hypothetical protein
VVAFGLGVEHAIVFLNGRHAGSVTNDPAGGFYDASDEPINDARISLELRLGGGSHRLVGYGLLAPGIGLGASAGDVHAGFAVGFGAGLWGIVWRGLFLGAEVGTDLMLLGEGGGVYEAGGEKGAGTVLMTDIKAVLGWHFGWKATK